MLRALAIDFNSYFASVEQQERPELRGQPVAVVPVMAETSGAIAVSIEGKARGLTRNVRISEARQQCPGLIVVEARPEVYINYHRRLKEVVETCVPVKKIQSIDELECELTGSLTEPDNALDLARRIKAVIAREVGPLLRSSIGIGPNWFIAKLASDIEKPDGLVLFDDQDIPGELIRRGVQLGDLTGIGANMEQRLVTAGIRTVAQLYTASSAQLRAIWGSVEGARFHDWLHGGLQEREPVRHNSIGHGHVLPPKLRDNEAALGVLHRLLQKAAMRLRHDGCYAGALHVSVNYRDDIRWSKDIPFNETQDTLLFTQALNKLWAERPAAYRKKAPMKVGIILHSLLSGADHTPDLFEAGKEESRTRLHTAVDKLNRTFGKNSVYFGGAHGSTDYAPMRIAFTRIPQPELEEIDRSMGRRLKPTKQPPKPPVDYDESPPPELQ